MSYLSKVAVGIQWQSIHFFLPQLLRLARKSHIPRVPCLRCQNKPIITRSRKPQQSLKKYDCLLRLLGNGCLILLGFKKPWTLPQLLPSSGLYSPALMAVHWVLHGCPKNGTRSPILKLPFYFHSFRFIYLGRAHCREQREYSVHLNGDYPCEGCCDCREIKPFKNDAATDIWSVE